MAFSGLIVGLGNPGKDYEQTRHNFGFMAIDALTRDASDKSSVSVVSKQSDPYTLWRSKLFSGDWLFCTPLTYMNNSGTAVQRIAAYYSLTPEDILVIHDELDLPLGRMKFKKGGSNAGHNGLKSIQQHLGSPDFYRLRLGVGRAFHGKSIAHVLSKFHADEQSTVTSVLEATVQGTQLFMSEGPKSAQQFCNSFIPDC